MKHIQLVMQMSETLLFQMGHNNATAIISPPKCSQDISTMCQMARMI